MSNNGSNSEGVCTCPECGSVFGSAQGLWGHSRVHRVRTVDVEPPAAPLPLPAGGVGVAMAAGSAAWLTWKVDSPHERDRTCPTCNVVFASPKAMYGHLHAHYERGSTSRKPRAGSREAVGAAVAPAVAQEEAVVVVAPAPEEEVGDRVNGEGNFPLLIDLNRSVWAEEEEDNGDDESPIPIDLNRTPPRS